MPELSQDTVELFWYYTHKFSRLRFQIARFAEAASSREEARYWKRHYDRLWYNIMRFKGKKGKVRHAS